VKAGKLPPQLLKEMVLTRLGAERREVVVPARFGEDSSVIDLEGRRLVISTDPITGAGEGAGRLAILVTANDVAASGGEPLAALLTVILPVGTATERVQAIMEEAHAAAQELGIALVGGHTEVAPGVRQPILSATVVGKELEDLPHAPVTSGGAHPGDAILLTKGAGVEGTAILAHDFAAQLLERGVGEKMLVRARAFSGRISVVEEAVAAARAGASAMHDVTEGGVLGALYEMAEASGVGMTVRQDELLVAEETRLICEALDLDPLRLISSGSLLIAAPDPVPVVDAVRAAGADIAIIGRAVPGTGVYLVPRGGGEDEVRLVPPPESDELWRAIDRRDAAEPDCDPARD